MARKKSRQANRAPAAKPPASAATLTSAPPAPPAASVPATAVAAPQTAARITKPAADVSAAPRPAAQRAWIELVGIRLARLLGSLQLAVILLSLFTLAVFLGTLMEHWYDTKIAQTLVYKAWWFVVLLLLLALNIFFAAAKKWPWKKHQTGFVITHVGLLIMLAGGVWHWAAGTDAGIQLIDNGDPQILDEFIEKFGYISQSANSAIYNDTQMLRVMEYKPADPHAHFRHPGMRRDREVLKRTEVDFEPGPLAWKTENPAARSDMVLRVMNWLENPLGHSWGLNLDKGARLEVIDFLPHANREDYSPSPGRGFAALKLELRSSKFNKPFEKWVGANLARGGLESQGMPILVEVLGTCPVPLVREFLNPPPPDKLGKMGVLAVVAPDGTVTHLPVQEGVEKPLPGGRRIKITRFVPEWLREERDPDAVPGNPAVEIELFDGNNSLGRFEVVARISELVRDVTRGKFLPQGSQDLPLLWLHAPDPRRGQERLRGVLQFVQTDAGALYYRSFVTRDNKAVLEKAGPTAVGNAPVAIWDKMAWKFRVQEHLKNAVREARYTPAPVPPGKATEEDRMLYRPAILCKLSVEGKSQEFWVPYQSQPAPVEVGGREFGVQFTIKQKALGFEIKLERAEQTVDPGTRTPASYSSFVQLSDPDLGIKGERHLITMNEPMEHRGYKFYQITYQFLNAYDANGKPVSLSGFTVGHDPGLKLKYLGSLCLGLGIFCMFYMKAYFFKPRRRPTAATATEPAQEG
jgi:hypothetical protein